MKRLTLTLCASALLIFSCSDSKTTDKTGDKDSTASTTTTATDGTTITATDEVPMDSAAMQKAWGEYMTPGAVHAMLAKQNGHWEEDITFWMDPAAPPSKMKASASNKMILGGRYQESTVTGTMEGMPFEGKSTLGFDNHKKTFQSTWVDNMGTGVTYMEGTMDSATHTITLKGKSFDPITGKDLEMRQTFVMMDDNNAKMEMFCTKGGKEMKNMEAVMKRK